MSIKSLSDNEDKMKIDRRSFMGGMAILGAATVLTSQNSLARKDITQERLIVDGLDTSVMSKDFLKLLRKGGVDCVHSSAGSSVTGMGGIYKFVDENSGAATIAKSVADIRQAKKDGKVAIVFGSQEANYLERLLRKHPADRYEPIISTLRGHYELGLRTHGICYNVTNVFGGGNLDNDVPLTRAGEVLVEEIHKLNIVLDVGGHTGEQTSFDAIAMSGGIPVVCTHTNMKALMPNIRAISDKLCEAIAKTNGVIGITAISDFQMRSVENYEQHGPRSSQATLDIHLDQYDHLKKLVGIDHVALGPDFIWGWGEKFHHRGDGNVVFPTEVMSDGQPQLVKGFEDISKLDNVINGLKDRGWSKKELDKMLGDNWLRVYKEVWGG